MVEGDAVEIHPAGQQPRLVAAGAQATGVGDFGGGAGPRALGHVLGQLHQPQHLAAHLPPIPGGKWHSMQDTSLWLDCCQDL